MFSLVTLLLLIQENLMTTFFEYSLFNNRESKSIFWDNFMTVILTNNLIAAFILPILSIFTFKRSNTFWKLINIVAIVFCTIYFYLFYVDLKNG